MLTRGLDYEIDYDVGQVRLLDADALFTTVPDAAVRASWEQRSLFEVSPTQVFGFRTSTAFGEAGGFDVLGLYRSERSVVRRPVLGTEPGAALLGGVTTTYSTTPGWIDRVLDFIPGLRLEGRSSVDIEGELAFSVPDPNTGGRAFVDDFDASQQLPVSLVSSNWRLGSGPTFTDGVEGLLPGVLDASTAAPMTWQTQWIVEGPGGDSLGIHEGYFARQDIDRQIRVAGAEAREPGLLLDLGRPPSGGAGWRSTTTSLSTQGLDLTRTEFLEVYVAAGSDVRLVLDLGTVSEDALFVDPSGSTSGMRPDGRPWGLGVLDQEADPARGELWNNAADALGVWNEGCLAERGAVYRIGDPRSVCTRGNGRPDSEDLDQDGILDTQERHLRYVVTLDGASPYLARTAQETGSALGFQLYRIPIRDGGVIEVGGAVGDADLRSVRHLRITASGPAGSRVRLARMRLVGSRWIKRGGEGILAGIGGDTLGVGGRVEVSSVSRVTDGASYNSPPGVLEELVDPTSAFAGQGIEFNEKSLGIAFEDLLPGTRAEVY